MGLESIWDETETLLHEVMKMKPGCQWRPKDIGYARVCETFAKENSTHEEESAQERVVYISERKAGRMGSSKLFEF